MTSMPVSVEQWMELNADRLVQCRWGCTLTREACHSYQVRAQRYVLHFAGDASPVSRPNGEYLRCLLPEPCPNVISDEESRELRAELRLAGDVFSARRRAQGSRLLEEHLISPNAMLEEADWKRSLVRRPEE